MNLTIPQLLFTWLALAVAFNVCIIGCWAAYKVGTNVFDWLTQPRKMTVPPLVDDILTDPLAYLTIGAEKKPPQAQQDLDEAVKVQAARETARRQALSHATTCMTFDGGGYVLNGYASTVAPQIDTGFPYESVTKDHVDAMFPQRFDYYRHK
jgi:hypothetical protein